MRWFNWTSAFETNLRNLLLLIAVVASVALPYAIIRNSADKVLGASEKVLHSAEVTRTLYELGFVMSELESLVLIEIVDVPAGENRTDYETQRSRALPLLDQLADMTRDNVDQQSRIGSLRVLINGRLAMLDTALTQTREKNFDAARNGLIQGALTFGSRGTSWQIVEAEQALFEEREKSMASTQASSQWTVAIALLAQLLLLGSVIFVSERQTTHRRKAESDARFAVERSRIIVQTLREPIAVLDPELRVLMTNAAFAEFYARPEGLVVGENLEKLGDRAWDDPELHQRLLDVAARGREIWDYELEQRSSDGIERIVLVNARRMDVSDDASIDGKPSILVTVSDVTARKRYEERITELNEDLEAKVEQVSEVNRELESFSYSVSHDLRAPLRHIAGFSDKLGTHIADTADDKARHYLNVIGESARRMSALIENLLEYSRLGRDAFRVEPVNMNVLIAETVAMLRSNSEARSIDWQIAELPTVTGDTSMLRRVWQNLISNAVKYTSKREHALIEIGIEETTGPSTTFFVRDNGAGFDMAYASKLFGVFQRLHKASEFAGTGIGLANVRRIINRHGGNVWAEAEPDKGATLYFSLPAVIGSIEHSEDN